jgi:acyl-CoA synthetase (AMP-forming)/AMP-acid ligase II
MFDTVVETFADSLERWPEATAAHVVDRSGEAVALSNAELYRGACRAAKALSLAGLRRGDLVLLALPTSRELLEIYLASLYTGIVPMIVPAPKAGRTGELAAANLGELADAAGAARVLLPEEASAELGSRLGRRALGVGQLLDLPRDLSAAEAPGLRPVAGGGDPAHLQATSGSTGRAKLAVIRHRNLAANVRAIGRASGQREGDVVVTWLPLYHDMGLIGICCCLDWRCQLVATDSANFVRNPINSWLRLIGRFGATISPAPTSAYQVCARLASRRRFDGLDLSTWRVAYCGAEPIREQTLLDFQAAFGPYGLPPTTLLPVYGLAEATLAVTIPRVDEVPRVDRIDADILAAEGRAEPAGRGSRAARRRVLPVVTLGGALPGHELRIVDGEGRPLGEREVGEVECAGPSVISDFWGAAGEPEGWKTADGFLRTGDLGYLAGGELHVTGRQKDILILGGRNFLPGQIESLVESVSGSPATNGVAAVGVPEESTGTEALHLIVESRPAPPPDRVEVEERIRAALLEAFGLSGVTIHWVEKGEIPKTTSGKIQRFRCREMLLPPAA